MIIIARYNEDVAIPEGAFVIQKDVHLPNVGREASSYLWYIIEHYNNLPDVCQFRQAKSHEHNINEFTITSDHTGKPHDHDLPITELADALGLEIPETLFFTAGAQFDVTKEQILARSKEWYELAYKLSMEVHRAAWALERMWKYIFNL